MRVKLPNIPGINYEKLPYLDFIATYDELETKGWVKLNLGKCSDGTHDVIGLSLGNTEKPTIYLNGGIHGYNEWRCCYWVRQFAKELVEPTNMLTSTYLSELKSKFHFLILPCLNPYGYINFVRWNANEVDINRNFPPFWESFTPEPGWGSKGDFPFSEAESQIVRDLVNEYKPILFLDHHSWGAGAGGTNQIGSPRAQGMWRAGLDAVFNARFNIITNETLYYGQPSERPIAAVWVAESISQMGVNPLSAVSESGFQQPIIDESYIGMNQIFNFCWKINDWYTNRRLLF